MILDQLELDANTFAAETGWGIKPEGACKGADRNFKLRFQHRR
jgi:hypothetical protein